MGLFDTFKLKSVVFSRLEDVANTLDSLSGAIEMFSDLLKGHQTEINTTKSKQEDLQSRVDALEAKLNLQSEGAEDAGVSYNKLKSKKRSK